MENTEHKKQNLLLKGRTNFLPWLTRLEGLLSIDDVLERNVTNDTLEIIGANDIAKAANEKKAKKYIIQNCDDAVMHSVNPSDTFALILAKLNKSYGFGHIDPSTILSQLKEIRFHPSKDPSIILNEIDIKLAELESSGGAITDSVMVQYMHDALSGDPLRDAFWFNCKGQMNLNKLSTYTVETAGQYIVKFWYAYKPKKITESSNFTQNENKQKYENRFCQHCKTGMRLKIMKTHNTGDCRIFKKEQTEGTVKETVNLSQNGNKETEKYLYHDSGTSKTMLNYKTGQTIDDNLAIQVFTAGANEKPQIGVSKGILKLGSIEVETLEVPTFSKNLLSATQLSIEHGCKQVIEPWSSKLTISKGNEVIATGTYDKETKLIKIDQQCSNNAEVFEIPNPGVSKIAQVIPKEQPSSSNLSKIDKPSSNVSALPKESTLKATSSSWSTIHRKLGHISSPMMSKTLKASNGLELSNKFNPLIDNCDDCFVAKSKRNNISKGVEKTPHKLLDVVEIDIQGPFPIIANDGTNYNIKMIDSRSNFLYYTTVPDTKSTTAMDKFMTFKARIEKQTGLEIKRVRTDGGPEVMGEFLAYLELSGIIKEKGVPYTHHHPGKVERAHQTILRQARAMLRESLLPPKFYNEAQKTSAYIFNRTVHGNDTITPYEHVFNRPPTLKHLQPFGTVCYAFIPPEKRSKLEDSGIRCRLLGYGDDFETEEIKGYRLLNEQDGTIFWSDSVVFDKTGKMEKLDDIFYSLEDDSIQDNMWTPFIDETDETDDGNIPLDAEDELSEIELCNIVSQLQNKNWWKKRKENPILELHAAMKAVIDGIPATYKQAMESEEATHWKAAMDVEMANIKANDTYRLYKTKKDEKAIGCRWVFRKKLKVDGSLEKYKARLVAKGYLQQFGKDYNETYAPVAKFKSIRLLLAIAAQLNQKIYQDDCTSAFLNGILKERVLMDQPDGYEVNSDDYKWLLKKTLYGLKQSPREWNEVFHNFMIEYGFIQSICDPCLYIHSNLQVGLYVDDIITTGNDETAIQTFRDALKLRFKCSKGGLLTWVLGMEVIQDQFKISINQNQYVEQKLHEFTQILEPNTKRSIPLDPNFQRLLVAANESVDFEPQFPYRQIVGSLMYAATGTRPDIMAAVAVVSRFLEKPKKIHCDMVRQILYYLRQNPSRPLTYRNSNNPQLMVYCDSSYANTEDYSSISGFGAMFGNCLVSWSSKKQPVVALSSTEAEYVAVTSASQEALWFQSLLYELGIVQNTVIIQEDNESCINLANNPQEFNRTRHIQVKYHFIRQLVKEKKIKLQHCRTQNQLADIFTKGVNGPRLKEITQKLGLESNQHGRELEYAGYLNDTRALAKGRIRRLNRA